MGTSQTREVKSGLQEMDPFEFEEFVADLWEVQGWEARATRGSQDMGVDVHAAKSEGPFEQRLAIQAKCYSQGNVVGQPEIKEYYALRDQEDVDAVVVVTTSRFSSGAEDWADEHNLKLVDGDDLVQLVEEYDCRDLVDEYTPGSTGQEQHRTPGEPRSVPEPEPDDSAVGIDDYEDVKSFRKRLDDPSSDEAKSRSRRWNIAWAPEDYLKKYAGGGLIGGLVLGIFLSNNLDGGNGLMLFGLLVGGVAGSGTFAYFYYEGRALVNDVTDQAEPFLRTMVDTKCRQKLGMTGNDTSMYHLEETESSPPGIDPPEKIVLVSLVIGRSSIGVLESGYINFESLKYRSGEVSSEFYFDQVASIDHDRGSLVVHTSDGQAHEFDSGEVPRQAIDDLQDRVRRYKR